MNLEIFFSWCIGVALIVVLACRISSNMFENEIVHIDTNNSLYEELQEDYGCLNIQYSRCQHEIQELCETIMYLEEQLKEMQTNPLSWIKKNYQVYNLEVTAYSPSVDECDSTPFIAASGESVDDNTVAVSQNMRKDGWDFGKFIYIPDHGKFYKINDVMNKRYTERIDIFKWTKQEAKDFGFCNVDVYLIN